MGPSALIFSSGLHRPDGWLMPHGPGTPLEAEDTILANSLNNFLKWPCGCCLSIDASNTECRGSDRCVLFGVHKHGIVYTLGWVSRLADVQ